MKNRFKLNTLLTAGKKSKIIKSKIKQYILDQQIIYINKLYSKIIQYLHAEKCTTKFPPNINGPGVVAHDTASYRDSRTISKGVIKIDIGVVYKKVIIDTAFSISFNTSQYLEYHKTNEYFFDNLLPTFMKPGLKITELSAFIEEYYRSNNIYVIPEMLGHTINPPFLHTRPYIPCVSSIPSLGKLEIGQIFTVEPHTLIKSDNIIETDRCRIYGYKTEFYSTHNIRLPVFNNSNRVQLYPVIVAETAENESFLYEHTYYVTEDKVIRLS